MLPPRVRPCPRPLRLVCACRVARAAVTTIHVCLRSLNVAFNEMVDHSSLRSLNKHLAKSVTSPHSAPLAEVPTESWVSPHQPRCEPRCAPLLVTSSPMGGEFLWRRYTSTQSAAHTTRHNSEPLLSRGYNPPASSRRTRRI